VALELASGRYGLAIDAVVAIGIKFQWTAEEVARTIALSKKPNPVYATRVEAAERHLKLAGLSGLIAPDAVPDAALRRDSDLWTLAFDPQAFDVGTPDMPKLLAEAQARVRLATGERDAMCKPAVLQALRPDALILPGLGHNAQVERPQAIFALLDTLAA
jgi:pimeloyl-ACP methyl ester carboxylesterase